MPRVDAHKRRSVILGVAVGLCLVMAVLVLCRKWEGGAAKEDGSSREWNTLEGADTGPPYTAAKVWRLYCLVLSDSWPNAARAGTPHARYGSFPNTIAAIGPEIFPALLQAGLEEQAKPGQFRWGNRVAWDALLRSVVLIDQRHASDCYSQLLVRVRQMPDNEGFYSSARGSATAVPWIIRGLAGISADSSRSAAEREAALQVASDLMALLRTEATPLRTLVSLASLDDSGTNSLGGVTLSLRRGLADGSIPPAYEPVIDEVEEMMVSALCGLASSPVGSGAEDAERATAARSLAVRILEGIAGSPDVSVKHLEWAHEELRVLHGNGAGR